MNKFNNQALAAFLLPNSGEITKENIVTLLNTLIQKEHFQRDFYEWCHYMLPGPCGAALQDHVEEHMKDEMDHTKYLQRHIIHFGGIPILERLPVPKVESTLKAMLEKNLEMEKEAVQNYTDTISLLEPLKEFTALRVDIETVLSDEMEHVQDLERWLKECR